LRQPPARHEDHATTAASTYDRKNRLIKNILFLLRRQAEPIYYLQQSTMGLEERATTEVSTCNEKMFWIRICHGVQVNQKDRLVNNILFARGAARADLLPEATILTVRSRRAHPRKISFGERK